MLHRLALALGRTLAELSAPGVLSAAEFEDWCEFYRVEPWGAQRDELNTGIIAATVANTYSLWVSGEASNRPIDFMPYADKPAQVDPRIDERELTDEELAAWADAALFGIGPEEGA